MPCEKNTALICTVCNIFYNIVHSDCDRYCITVNKETSGHFGCLVRFYKTFAVFLIKKSFCIFLKNQRWSGCLEAGGLGHLGRGAGDRKL